jgi:hypothetical protein
LQTGCGKSRLARRNTTGFTNFEFSMGSKWLEELKAAAPLVTSGADLQPEDHALRQLFEVDRDQRPDDAVRLSSP